MQQFTDSPFEGQLDVVATLTGDMLSASLDELRKEDELTVALRSFLRDGVSIDDLSAASGLLPSEIRRRCEGELHLGEDLETLAGLR